MMLLALPIATLPLLAGGVPPPKVSVELRSSKPEILIAEPYDLRVALVNHGTEPIAVAPQLYGFSRILLTTDGAQVGCEKNVHGMLGATKIAWEMILPGTERLLPLPAFQCFCKAGAAVDCQDWLYRAGQYNLSVVFSHQSSDSVAASSSPKQALDGTFDSNSVAINVKEPTGVDADALAWAKSIGEHPFSIKVVNKFPSSTYAALVIYGKMTLADTDPATIKKLVDKGAFPVWNSVPDPSSPDGWSSLDGEEFARWQVHQAEQILRNHPGFPYSGQLRLVIGVNSLRLGMKEQGKRVLVDLAKHADKAEGAWAKTFLSLEQ